jgi:hypothetical protein
VAGPAGDRKLVWGGVGGGRLPKRFPERWGISEENGRMVAVGRISVSANVSVSSLIE